MQYYTRETHSRAFLDKMEARPDVRARELLDEFFEKQDEPQYMRNVLSGLSSIMLVSVSLVSCFCGSFISYSK